MPTMVYQYGLLPPVHGEEIVRSQLRATHDYQNDLVAIERGRRSALRAIDDASDEVREAALILRAAIRNMRKSAEQELRAARKRARADAADELARIQVLDELIRRDAREITPCWWGSYLDVEARHQQSRAQPLYGDDAMTPNDPSFRRGPRWQDAVPVSDPRRHWWMAEGQLGVQLQGGISVEDALGCVDTRLRIEHRATDRRGRRYCTLWMRVGSDGRRAPLWAAWPLKIHRDLPAGAVIKWARVSVRPEGTRERWTVEITVDVPPAEQKARPAGGTLIVEWGWTPLADGGIRVASWCDDRGDSGDVVLPARIAGGIVKPHGIRAVRDLVRNDAREQIARIIREDASAPVFARQAAATMHLWGSPLRFRALWMQWREHLGGAGVAPRVRMVCGRRGYDPVCEDREDHPAYAALAEYVRRDLHLHGYEAGARANALRYRRDWYRCLAREWRGRYRAVLYSDQDLSHEARWGDDSDVRFAASPSKLRDAVKQAFGDDAIGARWRVLGEDEERPWCERTRDAWIGGGARGDGRFAALKAKTANAWAARRARKRVNSPDAGTARNGAAKAAG